MAVELRVVADDQDLLNSLSNISGDLEMLEDQSDSLGGSLQSTFDGATDASAKLNKQVKSTEQQFSKTAAAADKTSKSIDKTGRSSKTLIGRFRSARSSVSALRFAAVGAFGAILGAVTAAVKVFDNFAGVLVPAIATQKQLTAATEETAGELVKEKINLERKLQAASDNNENTKERIAARKELIAQYPEILQGNSDEAFTEAQLTAVRKAGTAAIIENLVQKAKQAELQRIVNELAKAEAETIENTAVATSTLGKIADGATGIFGNLLSFSTAGFVSFNTEYSNVVESLNETNKESLIEQAGNIGEFEKGLRENLNKISETLDENKDLIEGAAGETGKAIVDNIITPVAKAAPILAGSIADLERQLQAVNKQIRESVAAGDREGFAPLVASAKKLEGQIEIAKTKIKELRGELEETAEQRATRLQQQAQLIIDLTIDAEEREIATVQAAAAARQKDIENTVRDATIKQQLLEANQQLLQQQELQIIDKFATERRAKIVQNNQEELQLQQEKTAQQIALAEAELRAIQAAETQALIARGGTEQEFTDLQEQQELQRQRLTLESEKKRLQTVQLFSKGRTEIEIQQTQALIAAINTELDNLGKGIAVEGEKKGLLDFLGFEITPEQISALKQAGGEILGFVKSNLDNRIAAADKIVETQDAEISRLQQNLQTELQLREAGQANNVALLQQQIQEEENIRQQGVNDRQRAARTQFAIETATQSVNLLTSATEIIKAFATIPFVGVALGIAAVGAMFAGFVAARAKAFQATKLSKGGKLKGKKHSEGGVPMSVDGDGYTYEGEKGEWVVNALDSSQQDRLLHAINAGDFRGVDLYGMLTSKERAHRVTDNASNLFVAQEQRRERVQRQAIASAIDKQTDILLEGLNNLYEKEQITPTDAGYFIAKTRLDGGKTTKHITTPKF